MKAGAIAVVFALLAARSILPAQSATSQTSAANAEKIETGETRTPDGQPRVWRIRLLPLSSFPDLPEPVTEQLHNRHCMIPQSFEAKEPENVLHGSFRAPGTHDWAVLCSAQETTTLYVFFAGLFESPLTIRSQPDSAWLGAEPGSPILGSSWGIAVRSAGELRSSPELHRGITIDHDAIDDARLERSLTIRYFQTGRWITLSHSDSSD